MPNQHRYGKLNINNKIQPQRKEHKTKQLIAIALSVALMTLVKPSEVFALFIPLFWNVSSRAGFKEKRALIWKHRKQFLIAIGLAVMIFVPQLFYWYKKTGSFIFDSYQNKKILLENDLKINHGGHECQ